MRCHHRRRFCQRVGVDGAANLGSKPERQLLPFETETPRRILLQRSMGPDHRKPFRSPVDLADISTRKASLIFST